MTNQTRKQKPDSVSIKPQRMDFQFHQVPRHWFDEDPVLTQFLNCLSLTFPEGERFFVESVRTFRKSVTGKKRQEEISGFIGQEAMHSKEHDTFNELLTAQGFGRQTRDGEKLALTFLNWARRYLSKRQQLAATAGLEHVTAIMANLVLRQADVAESMDESVRDLWVWHAIEEAEHKAVAFDLYMDVGGNYPERVVIFLGGTALLSYYTAVFLTRFLAADGAFKRPGKLLRGFGKLARTLTPLLPDYLDYLRPGFHPWDDENSHLIKKWRATLGQYRQTAA